MRNRFWMAGVAVLFSIVFCGNVALAHFGMVIPSDTMVMQDDNRTVHVTLSFSHPMELVGMELVKPKVFGVLANGKEQDLLGQLKPATVMDHKAWQVDYAVKRPGVYMFHMEPQPYWEPAEDCFIIHLTKTVVTAFGDDEGWDAELGLKTEIVPIAKPFGLYAGNVFQGIVKMDGKPVPYAEVEVEFYNQDKTAHAPTDYMVTQTIKADADGVFTYATPAAGWWGFAALNTADYTIKHDGEDKDVEMGAVIWVYFHDWK
ncbi:ATP-dependent DNA ligase [Desulfosarcina ovata subsp. sediminis]|uniref:ATP-dependent DNA ligase n=2 Tax=Desulfosarcina ovata TaxID=83564 RepID=A0A5K7ZTH7_9BACT|nr:ATP-dependent DNA ligase [Desulfosarcina ovata subsp. sediminis]